MKTKGNGEMCVACCHFKPPSKIREFNAHIKIVEQ